MRLLERTRQPVFLTELFMVLTLLLGVWAVSLIILTTLAITQPSFYTFQKAEIKAIGSTAVALIAISQLYTMEARLGHLPKAGIKVKYLLRAHRWGGRIALILAALIAYFCITDIGTPTSPLRTIIHAALGASVFSVIAIKLALLRFRPQLGYRVAPWLGRYAVAAFIGIWITSAYAYFTNTL
jgi:predicted ferric reductase